MDSAFMGQSTPTTAIDGAIWYFADTMQSFRFFSRLVGRSDPWSKRIWAIFWNDGPKHNKLTTVDIWVLYFTYTLKQTLVCIYVYWLLIIQWLYSKTCLKRLLKKKKEDQLSLMQVKSIVECSKGSILHSFRPSLGYNLLLRSLFCLFWVTA